MSFYTPCMSPTSRILALSALVLGLAPAMAFACEDEAKSEIRVTKSITCVKSGQTKVCTNAVNQTKICIKNVNSSRRTSWSPGHLIEPDSMKLGPGDDLKVPDTEQWVILSSRSGVIQFRHYPPGSKKTEGRTLQVYGPHRS